MKKTKIVLCVIVLMAVCTFGASAQYSTFMLNASPSLNFTFGGDTAYYAMGGGGTVSFNYSLPFLKPLSVGLVAGYDLAPLAIPEGATERPGSLSIIHGGLNLAFNYFVSPRISLGAMLGGGYYYGFFNDDPTSSGSYPIASALVGASFKILPSLGIGAYGSFRSYFGLYQHLGFSITTTIYLGQTGEMPERVKKERVKPDKTKPEPMDVGDGEGVDIVSVEFENIFPVFFKYYDNNPIGTAVIHNFEKDTAEQVKVTFYVKQYMDNPKEALTIDVLESGESREFDLFGLFTNEVLDITEGTKVSALINISYQQKGKQQSKELIETIRLQNRNAVTWDDDRKACAFVTAKDPAVMKFSKNVAGWVKNSGSRAVNKNLKLAMALHEALDLYGISYVIDPTTPYVELSEDELAIDFLQFPKQTLEYLAGDCDDLSILYSALLEAAGVATAFVTTPGHIFVAFDLEMSPDDARKAFLSPDDLIFRENKTWLPVEITVRGDGFLKAWQIGAKEWRENVSENLTGFFEMHTAWELYEPVGFPGTVQIQLPDRNDIVETYEEALEAFIQQEIGPQLSKIQDELNKSQGSLKWINRLGVLYARYGMDDKALAEFQKVLRQQDYLPALLNIGNLYYIKEDLVEARKYYLQAQDKSPNNAKVLLAVARVDHDLENYGTAKAAYKKLQELDPNLADRFSYLDLRGDEAQRAADTAQIKGVVLWEEE